MTTTSPVVAREGRIVTITFNDPDNGNRLTPPVLATPRPPAQRFGIRVYFPQP